MQHTQGRSQAFGRGGERAEENIVLNFEKKLAKKSRIFNKFTINFKIFKTNLRKVLKMF